MFPSSSSNVILTNKQHNLLELQIRTNNQQKQKEYLLLEPIRLTIKEPATN